MDSSTSGAIQTTMRYRPLDPGSKQIRLLELHSGTEGQIIECHLEHVSLEDNPEFTALSYVWGDPTDPGTILLHGEEFSVTKNLHAALQSIRSRTPDGKSRLWVDAVCINQKDVAERSSQVALMQFIYSQAKLTFVWFGPGNELSKRAVQLILEMLNTLNPKDNPWFNEKFKETPVTRVAATVHPLTHLVDRLEAWEAMAYLVNLPWWTRVWVAQEIKLSKNPILLWGEAALRWIHCEEAMIMIFMWVGTTAFDADLQDLHGELQIKQGCMKAQAVLRHCNSKGFHGDKSNGELLSLMDNFWPNEATDPRDKVYALLSLATDNHSDSIVPDYKSPVGLVYAELVKDIITRECNLQVFAYCSGLFTPRDAAIPSWAPDWRSTSHNLMRPPEQRHVTFYDLERAIRKIYENAKPQKYLFRAAGDSPPAVGFCKQMKTLYAVGIRVDVISKISNPRSYHYFPAEVTDGWSAISGFLDYTNIYPPTGQWRNDACIETLSADQLTPSSPMEEFKESIGVATGGRRFFVGEAGYQGLALSLAQIKDVIVVLLGGACPLILKEMEGHFIMVGEAYVHGIMNGELMTRLENGQEELEEFEIW